MRLREVMADFRVGALLRFGQRKWQGFDQARGQFPVRGQLGRDALAAFAVMHAHRELLRQQFVEFDAPPRGVTALFQRTGRNIRGGIVQQIDACGEARQF